MPATAGDDPGAVSAAGDLEKEITLAIAEELEYLLQKAAIFAVMVRRGDYDLADSSEQNLLKRKRQDLDQRVAIAKEARLICFYRFMPIIFLRPSGPGGPDLLSSGQSGG